MVGRKGATTAGFVVKVRSDTNNGGKYTINLNGGATLPLIDLTVTGEPALINYDKNLRKTPDIAPSINLSGGRITGTYNRSFPDGSPVQFNIAISLIVDFQSPCIQNPNPCLIEAIISLQLTVSLVSNSVFIPQSLLPPLPPIPPITIGSKVLTNK
ncbi:hypothetical protein [uncultured Cytophaga sp.]|uniref:hypothetical protein n=1 Tax=uncultured Cytophaga sp. TaxID=160238 RepID=UPI00261C8808|nr:hypothetical protein [uncultured Cytophaga sp.]